MDEIHYDASIILGGGRYDENTLTPLSTMRLDKGLQLYVQGVVHKIILPGGKFSSYSPKAVEFQKTTAQLRKEYLLSKGNINASNIIPAEDGRDTIYEAFTTRKKAIELRFKHLLLVTSEKHMPRALYIFKRIFGDSLGIDDGNGAGQVATGDILAEEEEKEYLGATQTMFIQMPDVIPDPISWDEWYEGHKDLYDAFKTIHDKYHPAGQESQAYTGVNG